MREWWIVKGEAVVDGCRNSNMKLYTTRLEFCLAPTGATVPSSVRLYRPLRSTHRRLHLRLSSYYHSAHRSRFILYGQPERCLSWIFSITKPLDARPDHATFLRLPARLLRRGFVRIEHSS
jgi:hypothetical protein